MMREQTFEEAAMPHTLSHRKPAPRVYVVDEKRHVRTFLCDALEDTGFVTRECTCLGELIPVLDERAAALVVLGPSMGGSEITSTLQTLAARHFTGKILLIASRDSTALSAAHELVVELGIAILPSLFTPFEHEQLLQRVASLLPTERPPDPPIEVADAIRKRWLELWYQPKIDIHTFALHGVEALARIRHPTLGIISPAYFIPDPNDPESLVLSDFVIRRAISDWHRIGDRHGSLEMAINLPISFFQDADSIKLLLQHMQAYPVPGSLVVELEAADAMRHLDLIRSAATVLRQGRVDFSLDDLGEEWPLLAGQTDLPLVELKVDRQFITGFTTDRLKQSVCRHILDLAHGHGVRAAAEGIESRDDFLTAREMGFDLAQGFLFGRPTPADRFSRRLPRPMGPKHCED